MFTYKRRIFSVVVFLICCVYPSSFSKVKPDTITFSGEISRGKEFQFEFKKDFIFKLIPIECGWEIVINQKSNIDENIARLTPPFHNVPNPREIEGWHFRNESNTGPNDGSVNAPDTLRDFIFSPKVGKSISYPPSEEQIQQITNDGQGYLKILKLELGNLVPNERAVIEYMKFQVVLIINF